VKVNPLASLGNIGYVLGDPRPVEHLQALSRKQELLAALKAKGISQFCESACLPIELASIAARETLDSAGVHGADIQAIVYATTSFWEKRFHSERDITWLMNELGMRNAYPVGVFLPGCANATSALRVAVNMIRAEGYDNVMVVTTDKVAPGNDENRIMWPDVSILSDAAAACLVSPARRRDFDIVSISHHSAPFMWDVDSQSNLAAFLLSTVKGTQQTALDALQLAKLVAGDIRGLLTNNYNIPVMHAMARQCGFQESQVYCGNVARFAHGYAADSLINLKDYVVGHPPDSGEYFMLLATGHKNWGGVVLRKN
jgi:3-oxoacyl-[acyl-carrier-protein] synthase III